MPTQTDLRQFNKPEVSRTMYRIQQRAQAAFDQEGDDD
jgi:hypothetical protein